MRESVPTARYSPVCNVLRQWKTSLILTYKNHRLVREAILHHMLQIAHFMLSHHINDHSSVSEYIQHTGMDQDGTWGTDIEILTLAHLLNTCIFVCTTEQCNW